MPAKDVGHQTSKFIFSALTHSSQCSYRITAAPLPCGLMPPRAIFKPFVAAVVSSGAFPNGSRPSAAPGFPGLDLSKPNIPASADGFTFSNTQGPCGIWLRCVIPLSKAKLVPQKTLFLRLFALPHRHGAQKSITTRARS
jgi:hypothetical protein